jgi:type IV pilus assembly protein PilB
MVQERMRLGEILLQEKLITESQLERALREQKETGRRLGSSLVTLGFITESDLVWALEKQLGFPSINLEETIVDKAVLALIPEEICRRYKVVPLLRKGNVVSVAMVDPLDFTAIDDIKFMTGCDVRPMIASENKVLSSIERHYGAADDMREIIREMGSGDIEGVDEAGEVDLAKLQEMADDAPVIRIVNLMLVQAVRQLCSDIHIEIMEDRMRVRYRLDGVLQEVTAPPRKMHNAIISRVKILAGLDIAERRLPQDGRIGIKVEGRDVDIRVSIVPTVFGEKVVMRILDKSSFKLNLEGLGFEPDDLEKFRKGIHRPYGMVLVTGPTGSGKTTTLNSALVEINEIETNICTVEDPVEYQIDGVNQVAARPDIGLTFAHALRSFLRQDPDKMLVGEIRDKETAEIAVQASLTGHLVLSTVHTNDAPSAITRLIDMGLEPFLVASTVHLIQAQRLVRRICTECKEEEKLTPEKKRAFEGFLKGVKNPRFFHGKGCRKCNGVGYKGRVAIFEVMPVDTVIKEMMIKRVSHHEIKEHARVEGMRTLSQSGFKKAQEGTTTLDEVMRVALDES